MLIKSVFPSFNERKRTDFVLQETNSIRGSTLIKASILLPFPQWCNVPDTYPDTQNPLSPDQLTDALPLLLN